MRRPVNPPLDPGSRPVRALAALVACLLVATPALALTKEEDRLHSCQEVLEELLAGKESIPRDLLDKAECVAVVPSVKKFALGLGGRWGKGAVIKQDHNANEKIYGERVDAERLLKRAGYRVPAAGEGLVDLLRGASPRRH